MEHVDETFDSAPLAVLAAPVRAELTGIAETEDCIQELTAHQVVRAAELALQGDALSLGNGIGRVRVDDLEIVYVFGTADDVSRRLSLGIRVPSRALGKVCCFVLGAQRIDDGGKV